MSALPPDEYREERHFDQHHQHELPVSMLRTTSAIERINEEFRRRVKTQRVYRARRRGRFMGELPRSP
jgi:transposase-like protein